MSRARFIAGAVCVACAAVDRIVIEERNGLWLQRCVACGREDEGSVGWGSADAPASDAETSNKAAIVLIEFKDIPFE